MHACRPMLNAGRHTCALIGGFSAEALGLLLAQLRRPPSRVAAQQYSQHAHCRDTHSMYLMQNSLKAMPFSVGEFKEGEVPPPPLLHTHTQTHPNVHTRHFRRGKFPPFPLTYTFPPPLPLLACADGSRDWRR
jgi:hypothetical protein